MPDASPQPPSPRVSPPFQFSMRWLMIALTVVGVLLGLMVSLEGVFGAIVVSLVFCALPASMLIVAVFGRHGPRAFAIGGLFPWILIAVDSEIARSLMGIGPVGAITGILIAAAMSGAAALATYRWLERRGDA